MSGACAYAVATRCCAACRERALELSGLENKEDKDNRGSQRSCQHSPSNQSRNLSWRRDKRTHHKLTFTRVELIDWKCLLLWSLEDAVTQTLQERERREAKETE
jgi:hypothetical protein